MTTDPPSADLQRFAELADSFCQLLERGDAAPAALTQTLHLRLAELYVAALRFPDTAPNGTAPNDTPLPDERPVSDLDDDPSSPSHLEGVRRIAEHMGPLQTYREIFDPHDWEDESQCAGDIEDDLGDIIGDLAQGLAHWRAGNPMEALWEWRFNFQAHWGKHAISALQALHTACAWHDMPWPAPSSQ